MKQELDSGDWAEVFGEGDGGNCTPIIPNLQPPGCEISGATFTREDVAEIFGIEEGERDGDEWIVYGKLQDGRYFIARGGCDYTGWDCRASNSGDVANNLPDLIRYGMSDDERSRFNVSL
jgi:hypothetical protein